MSSSSHSVTARSWRDIPQGITPRAMSKTGRRRLRLGMAKTIGAVVAIALTLWGALALKQIWDENPTRIQAPVKSAPVRTVTLRTDGVLDHDWLVRTLSLPKNITLMEVDLYLLRERLLAQGQVRTAVLARKFPDTLAVMIEERSPVARVMAQIGEEQPRPYLVARDGVIFTGIGHAPELTDRLPYLDGVRLVRHGEGFAPIEGMETVADLLASAQLNVPELYRNWKIVSLARLASDGEIIVRSRDVAEVTFGTRDDFFRQLAQLDLIVAEIRQHADRPVRTVNLAVGGTQVPVSFDFVATAAPSTPSPQSERVAPLRAPPRRPSYFNPQNSF